jgi:hypothetical protein
VEDESGGKGCAYMHSFHVCLGTKGSGDEWQLPIVFAVGHIRILSFGCNVGVVELSSY